MRQSIIGSTVVVGLLAIFAVGSGCDRVSNARADETNQEDEVKKEKSYRTMSFDRKVEALQSIPDDPELEVDDAPPADSTVEHSDEEWREKLTDEEYRILRQSGTERAGTGELLDEKRTGVYRCAGCGAPLFSSGDKFDSGTGWPSFTSPYESGRIDYRKDGSGPMVRVETVCARCGGHLGHVFADGPEPTGKRYCINSAALEFEPVDEE